MTEWKVCSSYPTFMASDNGEVRHVSSFEPRKPKPSSNGYLNVNFWQDKRITVRGVHVLVADAWIGPRPLGMQVCHIDGDKTNNRPENLRYGTGKDNAADRDRHGRNPHGQRNGMAKLSDLGARVIRVAYASGEFTQYELAEAFGISQAQVNNIVLQKQRRRAA